MRRSCLCVHLCRIWVLICLRQSSSPIWTRAFWSSLKLAMWQVQILNRSHKAKMIKWWLKRWNQKTSMDDCVRINCAPKNKEILPKMKRAELSRSTHFLFSFKSHCLEPQRRKRISYSCVHHFTCVEVLKCLMLLHSHTVTHKWTNPSTSVLGQSASLSKIQMWRRGDLAVELYCILRNKFVKWSGAGP